MTRTLTNFRLTEECRALLTRLAEREGTSRAVVIEGLVRHRAEALGLRPGLGTPPARESGKKPRGGVEL